MNDDTDSDDDNIDAEKIADVEKSLENQITKRTLSSLVMMTAKCRILMMALIWRIKRRPNLMRKRRMT